VRRINLTEHSVLEISTDVDLKRELERIEREFQRLLMSL